MRIGIDCKVQTIEKEPKRVGSKLRTSINDRRRLVNFMNNRTKTHDAKDIWNAAFGILVSIIGGSFIGLSSKTLKESWIYCWVFVLLSFLCIIITLLSKKYSTRKSVASFIVYFIICGLSSPVSCWLGLQLP